MNYVSSSINKNLAPKSGFQKVWKILLSVSKVLKFDQIIFHQFTSENSIGSKGKIQSSEQGPTLRLTTIDTGYIKKPNFVRL